MNDAERAEFGGTWRGAPPFGVTATTGAITWIVTVMVPMSRVTPAYFAVRVMTPEPEAPEVKVG